MFDKSITVNGNQLEIDHQPDTCPSCHKGVQVNSIHPWSILTGEADAPGTILEIVFQCPVRNCRRLMIARYERTAVFPNQSAKTAGAFKLQSVLPQTAQPVNLPMEVTDVSPTFKELYKQSTQAELYELDLIAGAGYRKALEFLVKDFCISLTPNEAEAIRKKFLSNCIQDHIQNVKIQDCAKIAAWLGNDEVHYERKWTGKDVKDLKILIELLVGYIRNEALSKKYLSEMTPKNAVGSGGAPPNN